MFIRSRRQAGSRRFFVASTLCVTAALASSCMARPSDAPTVPGQQEVPVQREESADQAKKMREVTVGVDEFVEGFNPHLLADVSPVTSLVARLTLPSVFTPAPVAGGADDAVNARPAVAPQWLLNDDLLDSVQVIVDDDRSDSTASSGAGRWKAADVDVTDPAVVAEHVRYRIRKGAQWSDGTPISGEDFRYLHSQVTSTPGALDTETYELIKSIDVSDGGRQVDVKFTRPIAHWQRLFTHLLPAHLMRTNTDGFSEGLDSRFPASGGQYTVESMDVGRNIIRLVRNDRYWGEKPAVSEVITLRAMRSAIDGAEQLRSKQIQAVQVRPKETSELTYGLVPSVAEFFHEPNRELVFSTNLASHRLADESVRKAILSTIDTTEVAEVATGRRIPGDTGESGGQEQIEGPQAGFTEDNPLRIGIISDGMTARAAAFAVSDQLTAAGVPTTVVSYSTADMLRSSLPYGTVDAVVAWSEQANSLPAARERYACTESSVSSLAPKGMDEAEENAQPDAEAGAGNDSVDSSAKSAPSESDDDVSQPEKSNSSALGEPAEVGGVPVAPKSAARGENLAGLCDPQVDELLAPDRAELPGELADIIAGHSIEVTLVKDSLLTVVSPEITITGRNDSSQWTDDPVLGRLGALAEVRRVSVPRGARESSENSQPGDNPRDESGQNGSGQNNDGRESVDEQNKGK
ncbi:ABC transporter family substrate-binding protein [uncultured Corynebacterium sp.]|uniref:ABC transporter family substrate-binding protein n=1 Tax=uncultured Corynebacterium sp. TaxID=159447 RepID=UPI00260C502C|nr:ABC transporter family substrate-binding protein [uncultured Corynebacterium sp.]